MKSATLTSLNTIDGETLMSRPLQPLSFVVDTLISQGLHILAGSPQSCRDAPPCSVRQIFGFQYTAPSQWHYLKPWGTGPACG